jgi:hypothetical protein
MINTLNLQLEDIAKNIDYRLQYKFGYCGTCEIVGKDPWYKNMGTYIARTQAEVDAGIEHNINQYHGQLGSKECHITKPQKFCTFCNKQYRYDEYECPPCRLRVKEVTAHLAEVEYYTKQIAKLNRNKGNMTVFEKECQIKKWEVEITTSQHEAAKLQAIRK